MNFVTFENWDHRMSVRETAHIFRPQMLTITKTCQIVNYKTIFNILNQSLVIQRRSPLFTPYVPQNVSGMPRKVPPLWIKFLRNWDLTYDIFTNLSWYCNILGYLRDTKNTKSIPQNRKTDSLDLHGQKLPFFTSWRAKKFKFCLFYPYFYS